MSADAHEVYVLCNCGDVEHCRMEVYVSDVRIVQREFERLLRRLRAIATVALAS